MRRPNVRPWSPEDIVKLQKLLGNSASAARASAALGRTIISVQTKARELGQPFPHARAVRKARLAKEDAEIQRQASPLIAGKPSP
jgi:hypothetical protein